MYGLNAAGQAQFNGGIACSVLSAAAVLTRFYCKIRHKQGIHWDDYWIVIGLVFYLTSVACVLWGSVTGGGGMEMKQLLMLAAKDPSKLKLMSNYLESMFLGFTFVTTAIYAVKMSILIFYRRIFFITKGYQYTSLGVMIFATAWFIGTQAGNLTLCRPIDSFWNRLKPGKCSNFNILFLATGIVDTFIDLVILLLPVRMAFALHLPMRTKVAVAGIFGLGGFVVVTNIIRIRYIYQPNAKYVSFANAERWSNIHMVTAFVCACLPIYKPLWTSVSKATGNLISRYASSFRSLIGTRSNKSKDLSYVRMGGVGKSSSGGSLNSNDQDLESGYMRESHKRGHTKITVVGGVDDDQQPLQVPKGGIAYSRQVEVA